MKTKERQNGSGRGSEKSKSTDESKIEVLSPKQVEPLERHAREVHEAGRGCAKAILETARRLCKAHAEISAMGKRRWSEFVHEHLRWSESTVRAFLAMAPLCSEQSVDIVNALPGDTRALTTLAGLERTQLVDLIGKHEGDLSRVPREALLKEVKALKHGVGRDVVPTSNAPAPAGQTRRTRVGDDPLRLVGLLRSDVHDDLIEVADLERLLRALDELRVDIAARIGESRPGESTRSRELTVAGVS